MNNIETMAEMLRYRRPHRSKTERKFIQRFIGELGTTHDKIGNRIVRIGDAPIMYSCHTDSVHKQAGLQNIAITTGTNVFKLARSENISNCLGADNAAGIWLMQQMILAKKPGLYIFHRGEECGGVGSKFLTKNTPEVVNNIKAAIAFDRRDTKSIITHQWGGRCCSNEFAESLAKELNLGHKNDSGGSFTDTANYTDLIPECTNVSAGYYNEHSSHETLDMGYLIELRQSLLEYDWEKLVIKRRAGDYKPRFYSCYNGNTASSYKGYGYDRAEGEAWSDYYKRKTHSYKGSRRRKGTYRYDKPSGKLYFAPKEERLLGFLPKPKEQGELLPDGHELAEEGKPKRLKFGKGWQDQVEDSFILRMVKANPYITVCLLKDYGISADDMAEFVKEHDGMIPNEMYMRSFEGTD